MNNALLSAVNLTVMRGQRTVLAVEDFSVRKGEVVSLIGPNGAGKTTLLQALLKLIPANSGDIIFKDETVDSGTQIHLYRRNFSMVFQEPLLFSVSVRKNVAAGLALRRCAKKLIEERVEEALDLFGIGHLADRPSRRLSGGEAQRVSLARAFAIHPEILFLDEPFSALDIPTREVLIDDLERIIRSTGTTTVFATHDRMEALRLSDRIVVMNAGRVVQQGTPSEVTRAPYDEFVATFVGTDTILTGKIVSTSRGIITVETGGQRVAMVGSMAVGKRVTFCIHPEDISFYFGNRKSSARNAFAGTVEKVVPMGLYSKIQVSCGFMLNAYVTNQSVRDLSLEPGRKITASFKAMAVHIIKVSD